jgi:NADH:ubiquinone oxidoreductase subunit C
MESVYEAEVQRRENLFLELEKRRDKKGYVSASDLQELQMQFLTDVCGTHYPDVKGKEIGVIYHIHSLINKDRKSTRLNSSHAT